MATSHNHTHHNVRIDDDHADEDPQHASRAAARLKAFQDTDADRHLILQPIQPPIAEPPSYDERRIVHHFRTLRARIHDGPFYTVLDSTARVDKSGRRSPSAAHYNPFDSAPTYSQRFVRKRNALPRLSTRPFGKTSTHHSHRTRIGTSADERTIYSLGVLSQGIMVHPRPKLGVCEPFCAEEVPHPLHKDQSRQSRGCASLHGQQRRRRQSRQRGRRQRR